MTRHYYLGEEERARYFLVVERREPHVTRHYYLGEEERAREPERARVARAWREESDGTVA